MQNYGGEMFEEIRDAADDAFNALPAPEPRQRAVASFGAAITQVPVVSMQAYNNQGGG